MNRSLCSILIIKRYAFTRDKRWSLYWLKQKSSNFYYFIILLVNFSRNFLYAPWIIFATYLGCKVVKIIKILLSTNRLSQDVEYTPLWLKSLSLLRIFSLMWTHQSLVRLHSSLQLSKVTSYGLFCWALTHFSSFSTDLKNFTVTCLYGGIRYWAMKRYGQ